MQSHRLGLPLSSSCCNPLCRVTATVSSSCIVQVVASRCVVCCRCGSQNLKTTIKTLVSNIINNESKRKKHMGLPLSSSCIVVMSCAAAVTCAAVVLCVVDVVWMQWWQWTKRRAQLTRMPVAVCDENLACGAHCTHDQMVRESVRCARTARIYYQQETLLTSDVFVGHDFSSLRRFAVIEG